MSLEWISLRLRPHLAFAVLLCASTVASADGNKLLQECQEAERYLDSKEIQNELAIGKCLGLLEGVRQTLMILEDHPEINICWPKAEGRVGIKNGQAVRVVLNYLRRNPAQLNHNQVALAILAFGDAYPCK